MSDRDEIQTLTDVLECAQTECFLVGAPLAEQIEAALPSPELVALRDAQGAVVAWRAVEGVEDGLHDR